MVKVISPKKGQFGAFISESVGLAFFPINKDDFVINCPAPIKADHSHSV